jgi:hypothetical protein
MSSRCFSECFFQEGLLFLKEKKNSFDLRKCTCSASTLVHRITETVGGIAAAGWVCQKQGGYDLVDLDPRYRMVHFGRHLTQSE